MKIKIISFFAFLLLLNIVNAQVGIGTKTPNPNSILEVYSTTKGVKFPKLNATQIGAITSPAKGLTVFDTTADCLKTNFGTPAAPLWKCLGVTAACTPPATPTITSGAATCSAAGTSTVSNYDSGATYTFSPTTGSPTVGAAGAISGMVVGTSYTLTATKTGCTSAASASFSNAAQLPTMTVTTASGTMTQTVNVAIASPYITHTTTVATV